MPTVTNTDATLQGKSLITADAAQTITGLKTFDRSGSVPFAVAAGSPKVDNLDADKLDGQDGTYYTNASNLASGTVPSARLGTVIDVGLCQGRLTLTSGTPVTTSDVTAATTLYFAPYKGNRVALYDGTTWDVYSFAERSIAVPATTSQMYDVFLYNNAGTLTLELTAWTNDTTRATALTKQDGVYVKTGATTRRYLGSFRTTAVSGQTEDSVTKRLVWNYYNRVERPLFRVESTVSYTYSTATWRQANASTANQAEAVIGVVEDPIYLTVETLASNTAHTSVAVAIGLDSTTAPAGNQRIITTSIGAVSGETAAPNAVYRALVSAGYHFYTWLEWSQGAGTTTWYSNNGVVGTSNQSGISGFVRG